ncbi:MAG: DNA-binding domain-containing protein [Pseudomonadota bacterium]
MQPTPPKMITEDQTGKGPGQANFTAALFEPDADVPENLRKRSDGSPTTRRFDVYRNNVVASLVSVLEAGFPVTRAMVGDEFFRAMAAEYVRANRPKTAVLFEYGAGFPAFIASFPPAQSVAPLADCAQIEQARREVYHEADAGALDADVLSGIAPDKLPTSRIALHPATRLLSLSHPAGTIWQRHQGEEAPDLSDLPNAAEDVLVHRQGFEVPVRILASGQFAFLGALRNGETLATALDAATEVHASFDLAAAMALLLETGMITEITTD